MKCPNCKKEIENGSAFCEHCGARIKKSKKGLWITLSVIIVAVVTTIVVITIQEQMIIDRNRVEQHQLELEQQLQAEREARQEAERQAEAQRKAKEEAERQAELVRQEAARKAEAERKAELARQKREVLIYAQTPNDNQYCDGYYEGTEEYFSVDLNNLKRGHFRITFVFQASSYRYQYALVLSRGWRILGVCLNEDGSVYVTTNNQRYKYDTGLKYQPGISCAMNVEYNRGEITINGRQFDIEMNEFDGDNNLSSKNYSNGRAFLGYISSVRVYNIMD